MVDFPPVLEIKRTLDGREKRFDCQLIAGDRQHAVLLFVAPEAMHVHGIDLPSGTVTFGHFWTDRFYNVYHWLDGRGGTIGFYFNFSDTTVIGDGRLEWRDLTLDVLATPAGRLEVLDEHELPKTLDPEVRDHIAAAKQAILSDPRQLMAEIEERSRELYPRVFPRGARPLP
jgi:predicted RNA-binding protein associated with RNAse of E/G family